MAGFDWLAYCVPCRNWCCHDESPFASKSELDRLKVLKIERKIDGSCMFLDSAGRCEAYEKRPLECRIFPFDIKEVEGELFWAVWEVCPAAPELDCERSITAFEDTLAKQWDLTYVRQYVQHHKVNQPEKYSGETCRLLRRVQWANGLRSE